MRHLSDQTGGLVQTPDTDHIRNILEMKYYCHFFADHIEGQRILTQYGPVFIRIVWKEYDSAPDRYYLTVAEGEKSKPAFQNAVLPISLEEVLRIVGRYCKRQPPEARQMKLF